MTEYVEFPIRVPIGNAGGIARLDADGDVVNASGTKVKPVNTSDFVTVEELRRQMVSVQESFNTMSKTVTELQTAVETLSAAGSGDTVVPEPTPKPFPVYAHVPANRSVYWNEILARQWARGAFSYYPGPWGRNDLTWDQYWADIVARKPEGLYTVISPKAVNVAGLEDFFARLPKAWAEKMIFAYYQEPEDNHVTDTARAAFRGEVAKAGKIVRAAGATNAVELQEWTLNPANGNSWAGADNLAKFVDANEITHISWSLYEKNLKDRIEEQVGRILDFMARYPGLTWDASACGVAVPDGTPANDPRRVTRANLVKKWIKVIYEAGATGIGWFDHLWVGTYDYDSTTDPLLREALLSIPSTR